jgi:Spy/CpxP family protein refolding chaperone
MKLNRTLGLLIVATATVGAGAAVAAAATTTAATTATTTATTPAPGGQHWHHRHGGMLVGGLLHATKQLNLTEQQQTTIKGILSAARSQRQAAAGTNAADMTVLANPGDPNYAAALQTAKSRMAARMQSQADLQSQIYNVLTPDQKAKLPQVLAAMKTQAEQRRAAWQAEHAAGNTGAAGSN